MYLWFLRYWRVQRKSLLSRECYMHEHQRVVRLYLSPRIYWKWKRFFCNHSHWKEKHYHLCKTCFTSLPCTERDGYRPKDNGDNDTIVFNKCSVVKNLNWQRETWYIGLQGRTTNLNLGKLRKSLVSGEVKCSRLEPQDKGFSALPRNFSPIIIFFCLWFYRYWRV